MKNALNEDSVYCETTYELAQGSRWHDGIDVALQSISDPSIIQWCFLRCRDNNWWSREVVGKIKAGEIACAT